MHVLSRIKIRERFFIIIYVVLRRYEKVVIRSLVGINPILLELFQLNLVWKVANSPH